MYTHVLNIKIYLTDSPIMDQHCIVGIVLYEVY